MCEVYLKARRRRQVDLLIAIARRLAVTTKHINLVSHDYLVADENGAPPHRLVPKDKQALAQQILVRQKAVELEEIGDRDEAHAVRD